MVGQDEGLVGRLVGGMIRRSVRARFRSVYWSPRPKLQPPVILACNHHGWFDGYLMYLACTELGLPFLLWVEELAAFPAFSKCGAMPFPKGDAAVRAGTIRRTIRQMQIEGRSLVLFPEGLLHPPPGLLPFGRSLEFVADKVPGVSVVPVSIRYEISVHERPEAFLSFGEPVAGGEGLANHTRNAIENLLAGPLPKDKLFQGTLDVNERWSFKREKR